MEEDNNVQYTSKVMSEVTSSFIKIYRAVWNEDEKRPMCWQLDPTEGPSRVRRRLIRSPRNTDEKFLLPEAWISSSSTDSNITLSV